MRIIITPEEFCRIWLLANSGYQTIWEEEGGTLEEQQQHNEDYRLIEKLKMLSLLRLTAEFEVKQKVTQ